MTARHDTVIDGVNDTLHPRNAEPAVNTQSAGAVPATSTLCGAGASQNHAGKPMHLHARARRTQVCSAGMSAAILNQIPVLATHRTSRRRWAPCCISTYKPYEEVQHSKGAYAAPPLSCRHGH